MKIAIVYNYESQAVINLFGLPNREKYGRETIKIIEELDISEEDRQKIFEGNARRLLKI